MLPLESVPNFSEGRDRATIDAIGDALAAHARLLDVHADADHNRSVFTVVGPEDELGDALVAAVGVAVERIDLREHDAHPASAPRTWCRSCPSDRGHGARTARGCGGPARQDRGARAPVFLYAPPDRGPAFYRRGGSAALRARLEAGEIVPDFGPSALHETAGGVILGARSPLIAFNVNLRGSLSVAREVAAVVRERGGGFPGVRALGLDLPRAGVVQVSMNVQDWEAAALHDIVDRIAGPARGAVVGSEGSSG